MEVSVVVPVLNEAPTIGLLVEALLAQTRPPAEIVFADGGSVDGTRSILSDVAAAHPVVRVVDGDSGRAYAWLAVGRFSVRALNSSTADDLFGDYRGLLRRGLLPWASIIALFAIGLTFDTGAGFGASLWWH